MAAVNTIANFLALRPRDYRVLRRFELTQVICAGQAPTLNVLIEVENDKTRHRLCVRCSGVRALKLIQPALSLFTMAQLEVRDVSADQWEGIGFAVTESEDESVSFVCATFAFDLIESSQAPST
ncbi:MAG: hypothetical protein JWP97_3010 [Labilithrix sp.]|nr:hypothetical protein [Labilithrix sp.]